MLKTAVNFPEAWTIHVIRYLLLLGNYFTSLSSQSAFPWSYQMKPTWTPSLGHSTAASLLGHLLNLLR